MNGYSNPSVDAGRLRMKTFRQQIRPAGAYYAARFSIGKDDEILCLRRLFSRGGNPLFLEELVLPKHSAERDLRILRLREERAALCLEREYLDSEGRVIALQRVLIPEGGEEELIVER